jgi:cell division protein FtsB
MTKAQLLEQVKKLEACVWEQAGAKLKLESQLEDAKQDIEMLLRKVERQTEKIKELEEGDEYIAPSRRREPI